MIRWLDVDDTYIYNDPLKARLLLRQHKYQTPVITPNITSQILFLFLKPLQSYYLYI